MVLLLSFAWMVGCVVISRLFVPDVTTWQWLGAGFFYCMAVVPVSAASWQWPLRREKSDGV
jgi:hypothetical protein